MTYNVDNAMSDLASIHEYYQREHGACHLGSVPGKRGGTVWWMTKKNEPYLYVIDEAVPMRIEVEGWSSLTNSPPPWPFDDRGVTVVISW